MEEYIPLEELEQRIFVHFLEINKYKFTSIPNSTFTKSWKQKIKNKEQGLRAGLPDLLIIKNNKLYFIEMKRRKKGRVSPKQKEWIKALNLCDGVTAVVCYGADDAKNYISNV